MSLDQPYYAASSLGRETPYPQHYDPELLLGLERAPGRQVWGMPAWPAYGGDVWTAYELSWLAADGRPQVGILQMQVSAHSPRLVESKSLKLYLCSLHAQKFASREELLLCLQSDLEACLGETPQLYLGDVHEPCWRPQPVEEAICIDAAELGHERALLPDRHRLRAGAETKAETLVSHLFKSNCPVTGQPDWASVFIRYRGPGIEHGALLDYLLAFRDHADFHEHCVERIYMDLWQSMACEELLVMARYTRRGGIDINPWRASRAWAPECLWPRQLRQ